MTAAIAADNLAAAYSGRQVWAGASFTIEDGSFTAVLGPNGSGKTTLIRMILGLLPPEAGRLEVFGRQPRRGDPKIGYIPQRPAFDIELSIRGRDFVDLGVDGIGNAVTVTVPIVVGVDHRSCPGLRKEPSIDHGRRGPVVGTKVRTLAG